MLYQAACARLRTLRDLLEELWTRMAHQSNTLSYTLDKLKKKKKEEEWNLRHSG